MRTYLDTFIDMKIDECEESIRQITKSIDNFERRLISNENDREFINRLAGEYADVIIRRHQLARSMDRLHKQLQKRNIEAMVNDTQLNKG